MNKLHFAIDIKAPKQKVWDTMLGDATYRVWTESFNPGGSYYEGDWSQGSTMRFIGPSEDGNVGGMLGKIAANRPGEYLSIEYLGMIMNGKEDTTSDDAKPWIGAHENYTFSEKDGVTTLSVDLEGDVDDEFAKMFEGMWPKALDKLKQMCEQV